MINMCERGGQWEQACVFLEDMQDKGFRPDQNSVTWLSSAKGQDWLGAGGRGRPGLRIQPFGSGRTTAEEAWAMANPSGDRVLNLEDIPNPADPTLLDDDTDTDIIGEVEWFEQIHL